MPPLSRSPPLSDTQLRIGGGFFILLAAVFVAEANSAMTARGS